MGTRPAQLVVSDVKSLWQNASAAAAAATRWTMSLAAHLSKCMTKQTLSPADRAWSRAGACFQDRSVTVVSRPSNYPPSARERYCRNVCLRTDLIKPGKGA